MNLVKTYVLQFVFGLVVLSVLFFAFDGSPKSTVAGYIRDYNFQWSISIDGETTAYEEIPSDIINKEMSEVVYEKILPSYIRSGESILVYTYYQSVEVWIGHEMVYEFKTEEGSKSKTLGKGWHIIRLEKEYEGKEINIILKPNYRKSSSVTPDIFYGKSEAFLGYIIRSNSLSLLLCVILFTMGVLIIIGAFLFEKRLKESKNIIWLGFFAIMVSIWSIADLDVLPLFLGRHLLNSQITFISLKLIYIPVITYVRKMYHEKESKVLNILGVLSIADFFITLLLQMFGILDFKETLFVYHSLVICSVLLIVYASIKGYVVEEGIRKTVNAHLVAIIFLATCILLDLIALYSYNSLKDSGIFTKIGMLVYTIILLYLSVNKSIKLIHSNEQLERMEQIASCDAITQLSNRTAFQEDINAILQKDYPDYGIAVFDLNELKAFNDQYGHSAGDYYIIISSEILQDVFGKYGTVYRIGGDEFCAIIKNISENAFNTLEDKMNKRIEGLNGIYFSKNMSIAGGYATYNSKHDTSLNDTFERADKDMYEDKRRKKGVAV